jgi:hypothetical protein
LEPLLTAVRRKVAPETPLKNMNFRKVVVLGRGVTVDEAGVNGRDPSSYLLVNGDLTVDSDVTVEGTASIDSLTLTQAYNGQLLTTDYELVKKDDPEINMVGNVALSAPFSAKRATTASKTVEEIRRLIRSPPQAHFDQKVLETSKIILKNLLIISQRNAKVTNPTIMTTLTF